MPSPPPVPAHSVPALPVRRARATLRFERLYAALWAPACALAALAAMMLFGLHERVPGWAHAGGLAAGLATAAWLAWRGLRRMRAPSDAEAVARIEADSRARPGSFAALGDAPFAGDADDPYWRAHQDRLRARARRARLGPARAAVDAADRYGLRFAAALLLAAGVIAAGPQAGGRLMGGLTPTLWTPAPVVADVWIDPPAYTGQAPMLLVRSGALPDGTQAERSAPEGSVLRVRLSGRGRTPRAKGAVVTNAGDDALALTASDGALTGEAVLTRNAAVALRAGGARAVWPVAVTPDAEPEVRLTGEVAAGAGGRLTLPVETEDDYGIASAALVLRLLPEQPTPTDAGPPDAAVLEEVLEADLPDAAGAPGAREAQADLSEHPWAGLNVALSVRVTDGAGQTAATPPLPVRLPSPRFYDPLARTVIEQRRALAAAPSRWTRTARMLDALTLAPERFAEGSREYLLLRTAYHDVLADRGRDVARVAASFLPLAQALEDEGLTLARARLDEAAAALRAALERGADDAEVERLIEELRQAMNDYVAALAASGDATGEADAQLGETDLDDMLDAMRDAAERGAAAEAESLLSQLEQMLENLSISPGGEGEEGEGGGQGRAGGQDGQGEGSGQGGEGGALGQANDLIEEQRRLSDETYAARRGERGAGGLAGEQRDLRRALDALAQGQGGAAGEALAQARRAMEGAARALERGELGAAQALQESAIEGLAEGAGRIAEARRREGEGQEGEGQEGEGQGRASRGRGGAGTDPLGRAYGQDGPSGVEIPDLGDPERLRAVIETLRARVADPTIPEEERRYIEGLLERF